MRCVSAILRGMAASVEGEVVHRFKPAPKVKPKRRRPGFQNKTQRSDYMKEYMRGYRGDQGKDYQKMPEKLKKMRAEQRKRLRERFNMKAAK